MDTTAAEERDGLRTWLSQYLKDRRPIRVIPYRGYGTPTSQHMLARVLRDPGLPAAEADDSAWERLIANFERYETDEVEGLMIRAELGQTIVEQVSDSEGYLSFAFSTATPLEPGWHTVRCSSTSQDVTPINGSLLIPPPGGYGIISDIDDTVLESAVTRPLTLARHLLLGNAFTRLLFKGVPAFYQALVQGIPGDTNRPIFYLSGSPWNLYDLLTEVFDHNGMPIGPLLLRSLERETVMPALHGEFSLKRHKLAQIEVLLNMYPEKRFILLGDSSQQDPETYAEVAQRQPERVAAIYIRDVTGMQRDAEVENIALQLRQQGIPMLFADDTAPFAQHASDVGLVV